MKGIINTRYSLWIIAGVFAFTIFAQCVLFHYLIYKEILLSSLWHSPIDFFRFYLPAATMAVFFSSFVFLFKNKWWVVIVSLIFDVWIFANLWYYRANGILIDKYAVTMIGNLNGFWDSILALIRPADFVFLIITILLVISIILTNNRSKSLKIWGCGIAISLIMGLTNGGLLVKKYDGDWNNLNPFRSYAVDFTNQTIWYTQEHSAIHYFAYILKDIITAKTETKYTLNSKEEERIKNFINNNDKQIYASNRLIICIIESFNNYLLTKEIMPNLYNFINNNENIIYANHITSQVIGSPSADGQMIIQTGLLPIKNGAVCFRFPSNKMPSISGLYKKSVGLFPHDLNVWNQGLMSNAYNISKNEISTDNDVELFSKTVSLSQQYDNVMMLTLATHIPCIKYADSSNLVLPNDMPTFMSNYIKCMNVTDRGMEILLSQITSNERLKNTTIVITADHKYHITDIGKYGEQYNYSDFCPLIIYSPEIKEKTIITDTCYQMDIYPTILYLIGCEDYYWKGFGVNLLDSAARHNRPITPEEAYDLSDKIIRADYFRQIQCDDLSKK